MKNKGVYRLLSGVLCTSVLLSSQVYAATPADYSDFPQNWSKDAMTFAVKNNFITGVSEDKIAPKAALTRAQLAAILSRVMKTGAGDVSVLERFTDADKNAWYAGSMAKAVELNILYGDGDSIYPDRPVTRQELFTILVRAFSVTGGDEGTLAPYSDAGNVSSWAKAAISAMIAQGYAAGYEDKTIRPTQQVTREEFAQLLYRMQEFYGSSDSSDDKTETKTDEPTKTEDKKTSGGGGGGGSSSGGGSHSGGSTVTANKIVDETKATVQPTDMGTWLPLVFKDGFNTENVTVTVDGADVTSAMSKVTTDGTIAKLPLTGTPKQVVIKSGDKTQTITLSGNGTASVYTGTQYLPEYILAHGAVALWDYHLTNYDADGNVRTFPQTTTFDLNKAVNTRAFYSPDAELKEGAGFGQVSGEVIIKFNYNTEDEKAWFDGINTLQLAGYSERLNSLNNDLTFTKKTDTNEYGAYGQLTIKLGQSNFFSNGRYYVRVKSATGETVLVPIHVVNEKAPSMELTEMPESGKNLHFNVKDMTYGITSPIESVTLTTPNGKTEKLDYIEDYYLFGDTFVLYNDNDHNHIPYNGSYTLTISSNGFKTFETKFTVKNGVESQKAVVYQSAAYDVVTHATGSSSSSGASSEDGGSYMMPADLVFDTDLLANALLLHEMGQKTTEVEKVVDYWKYDISGRDSVFDKGATDYYKYSNYITAVNTAQASANWLSYEDYLKNAGEDALNPNRPYAVKAILEDGLLGETQYNGDYGKLTAPDFTVGEAKEGQEVVLTTTDTAYVDKIQGLYLNGDWQALREDAYEIDVENGTITIKADVLKVGENTISIVATGYQKKTITIDNQKVKETGLTLSVNKASFQQGETATITVENSTGDFLKNLTGVALKDKATGEVVKNVYYKGVEGSTAVYYEIDKDAADGNVLKLTLTAQDIKAGDYTVSLTANYYDEPLTAEFTVTAKDDSGEVTLTAPTVTAAEFKEKGGYPETSNYYRLSFGTISGTDLTNYLEKVKTVMVGEKDADEATYVTYSKEPSATYMEDDYYRLVDTDSNNDSSIYDYDVLDLAANRIDTTKDMVIVIKADGYADVSYTIEKTSDSGNNGGETTAKTAPEVVNVEHDSSNCYYVVSFKTGETNDTLEYLKNVNSVKVGDTTYKKGSYASGSYFVATNDWSITPVYVLKLGPDGFTEGTKTITVTAEGYEDLTFTYPLNSDNNGGNNGGETATTAPTGTVTYKESDNYYQVSFDSNDASEYIEAIKSVKVGAVPYVFSDDYTPASNQYVKGSVITPVLKLGPDGFTGEGDITITITADGYAENIVTYTMPSSGSDKDDTETGKDYPTVENATLKKEGFAPVYYRLTFANATADDVKAYLEKISEISINGKDADKSSYTLSASDENKYYFGADSYGNKIYIDFTTDIFTGEEATIVIKADGYKTLTLKLTPTAK